MPSKTRKVVLAGKEYTISDPRTEIVKVIHNYKDDALSSLVTDDGRGQVTTIFETNEHGLCTKATTFRDVPDSKRKIRPTSLAAIGTIESEVKYDNKDRCVDITVPGGEHQTWDYTAGTVLYTNRYTENGVDIVRVERSREATGEIYYSNETRNGKVTDSYRKIHCKDGSVKETHIETNYSTEGKKIFCKTTKSDYKVKNGIVQNTTSLVESKDYLTKTKHVSEQIEAKFDRSGYPIRKVFERRLYLNGVLSKDSVLKSVYTYEYLTSPYARNDKHSVCVIKCNGIKISQYTLDIIDGKICKVVEDFDNSTISGSLSHVSISCNSKGLKMTFEYYPLKNSHLFSAEDTNGDFSYSNGITFENGNTRSEKYIHFEDKKYESTLQQVADLTESNLINDCEVFNKRNGRVIDSIDIRNVSPTIFADALNNTLHRYKRFKEVESFEQTIMKMEIKAN
jgi:hypothetical protein